MAEITNDLIFELLKRIQGEITELRSDVREVRQEVNVIRGHLASLQSDIHNIYGILSRHDERLIRIERRLDIHELAEDQSPFDPKR